MHAVFASVSRLTLLFSSKVPVNTRNVSFTVNVLKLLQDLVDVVNGYL